MKLTPSQRSRGFTDADAEGLEFFHGVARELNMTPAALRQWEDHYLKEHTAWKGPDDAMAFMRRVADGIGLDEAAKDATLDDIATAMENGIMPLLEPQPSRSQDEARLSELQALMRSNPREYQSDPIQDEIARIYERLVGDDNTESVTTTAPLAKSPANNTDRRAEIEQMMRNPQSDYWGRSAGKAATAERLQQEYRNLVAVEPSAAGAAPPVSVIAGDAAAAPSGTAGETA